jgi:hypothetical protein
MHQVGRGLITDRAGPYGPLPALHPDGDVSAVMDCPWWATARRSHGSGTHYGQGRGAGRARVVCLCRDELCRRGWAVQPRPSGPDLALRLAGDDRRAWPSGALTWSDVLDRSRPTHYVRCPAHSRQHCRRMRCHWRHLQGGRLGGVDRCRPRHRGRAVPRSSHPSLIVFGAPPRLLDRSARPKPAVAPHAKQGRRSSSDIQRAVLPQHRADARRRVAVRPACFQTRRLA